MCYAGSSDWHYWLKMQLWRETGSVQELQMNNTETIVCLQHYRTSHIRPVSLQRQSAQVVLAACGVLLTGETTNINIYIHK